MIRKVIKEAIDPATGSGAEEVDEAIFDYMEAYAEIFADEGLRHPVIGPALLDGDSFTFGNYMGQLDSFSEWVDQLKYDGYFVNQSGSEYLRQTLVKASFFDMVSEIAQEKNNY